MALKICCEVVELIGPLKTLGIGEVHASKVRCPDAHVHVAPFEGHIPKTSLFKFKIFAKKKWTIEELAQAKNHHFAFGVLELERSTADLTHHLHRMLIEVESQILNSENLVHERENNRLLSQAHQNLTQGLQGLVVQRRDDLQVHKQHNRHLQKKVFFLKRLNEAAELSELLGILRDESKMVRGLGDPILVMGQAGRRQVLFFNNRLVAEKKMDLESLSLNHWRQSLANVLGRPVGLLLKIESKEFGVTLLFEHQLDADELLAIEQGWTEFIGAISAAVERLRLDQDLRDAAFFWEKTFDGLDEPIGILDGANRMIRANRSFKPELLDELDKEVVRSEGRVFHLQKFPISFGESAGPTSKVVHFSDQTSQYQLKQHMIQTEKIAALGQLAGHIAHELNNPLTGIRSLCQLLMTDPVIPDQQLEDLQEVERASVRCQKIITNLLEYSKPNAPGQDQLTEVNEVVYNTLPFLKTLMGPFQREIHLSADSLWAVVDPHLLQQVIFNIIANACYAMGDTGTLTLTSRRNGKFIEIEIQDSGPGVLEEIRDQIFDPFFTTKPKGEGTGLGLSFSRNFMRTCGGDLLLKCPQEGGSVFVIQLPYKDEKN